MKLYDGERLEDLQYKNLQIIQNKNFYTFTSDSVILANYIHTKKSDVCVEIGAGCGIISILVNAKNSLKKIYAFEIQKEMADLCQKNVKLNHFCDKIETIFDDIKNFKKYLTKNSVDVVFSNPPYFKVTNFSQSESKQIAKEEINLNLLQLIEIARGLLKDKGAFYCCYPSERVAQLVEICQQNNLKVKEMFFTENGKRKVKLVVIKAVKSGRNGTKVFPNLVTNESDGD